MERPIDRPRTPTMSSSPPVRSQSSKMLNPRAPARFRTHTPSSNSQASLSRSARRTRTADEMRIQVHDDGMVEFSVMLGAHVDASHLATLVNAVRSSSKDPPRPPKATTPSMASIDAALQQNHTPTSTASNSATVSSPDLKSLMRPPIRRSTASMPRNFDPYPKSHSPPLRSPQSPRLPDRFGSPDRPESPTPNLALPLNQPPSRSLSTPDLGRSENSTVLAPLVLRHTSMLDSIKGQEQLDTTDAGGDALMQDVPRVSFEDSESSYILPMTMPRLPPPKPTQEEDAHSTTWRDVRYEMSPAYRQSDAPPPTQKMVHAEEIPRRSFNSAQENTTPVTPNQNPHHARTRWRVLSRLRRGRGRKTGKQVDDRKEGEQKPPLANKEKNTGKRARHVAGSGSLGGFLEGVDGPMSADEWLEFSTLMTREKAMTEITRFAKLRGHQVWRRPGDQKLRCVRKLTRSSEMHMIVVIEAHPTTGGTLVRVRRARGDRGKTEWWRYIVFYRDVISRLESQGHSIIPLQPNAAHGIPTVQTAS